MSDVSPRRYFLNLVIFLVIFLGADWLYGRINGDGRSVLLSAVVIGLVIGAALAWGPTLIRRAAK